MVEVGEGGAEADVAGIAEGARVTGAGAGGRTAGRTGARDTGLGAVDALGLSGACGVLTGGSRTWVIERLVFWSHQGHRARCWE